MNRYYSERDVRIMLAARYSDVAIERMLNRCKSIDIINCKECSFREHIGCSENKRMYTNNDGFCSYGVRKDVNS